MKKFLALTLALVMSLSLVACGDKKTDDTKTDAPDQTEQPAENEGAYKVAMITDYGDITDQSFNQTTYEACKAFAEDNSIEFSYFRPAGDNTADRVAMIEKAVDEGYNVIVMPGYLFAATIGECQPTYPDVKFIALDVSEYDLTSNGVDLSNASNLFSAVYQEELSGYMAGYAAVKMGYKKLGFLGGMLASNYDVKTVFIDAFLKLIKIDLADAKWFFDSLEKYAQKHDVTFVLSVSADPEALPDFCKGYII